MADQVAEVFTEVILAPGYEDGAVEVLGHLGHGRAKAARVLLADQDRELEAAGGRDQGRDATLELEPDRLGHGRGQARICRRPDLPPIRRRPETVLSAGRLVIPISAFWLG